MNVAETYFLVKNNLVISDRKVIYQRSSQSVVTLLLVFPLLTALNNIE